MRMTNLKKLTNFDWSRDTLQFTGLILHLFQCVFYLSWCDNKYVQLLPRLGPLKLKCFSIQGIFLCVAIDNLQPRKCPSQHTAESQALTSGTSVLHHLPFGWVIFQQGFSFSMQTQIEELFLLTSHLWKLHWVITSFKHSSMLLLSFQDSF